MSTWGIYDLSGVDANGTTVEASDRTAVKWRARWRVDGRSRKRTFTAKGHAKTFWDKLTLARLHGWDADDRGWPIDPATARRAAATPATGNDRGSTPNPSAVGSPSMSVTSPASRSTTAAVMTFEEYCENVWWPLTSTTFQGTNLQSHRYNMRLAIDLLVYPPGDPRSTGNPQSAAGQSILLADLLADDVRRALVARRSINDRTAAANRRLLERAVREGVTDIVLAPEVASEATVRSLYITLQMILKAALYSGHLTGDPLVGTSRFAPKPKPPRITGRLVPSIDEVFALADAISDLGPIVGGRPAGERYRALILLAGTAGPRPGELVAHHPDLILPGDPTVVRFNATESPRYDRETGLKETQQTRPLKHREAGEYRDVPIIADVAEALCEHLERGFHLPDRTFTSLTGRAHLNWGNLRDTVWQPACKKVFAGTEKTHLATMPPKTLRKAAITWWLDSGIHPFLASEWAGHSAEVAEKYYAGRASTQYGAELKKLTREPRTEN